jgi:adenosylmethionine-8-amino-7-oxononanoate aminotransferase
MTILRTFPNAAEWPLVERGEGLYLRFADGRTMLDFTGGGTEHAVLGWSHPEIVNAIREQAGRIAHVDVKFYAEHNAVELADLLVRAGGGALAKVYYAGNSGGEACEAAMKLSYQIHCDRGRPDKRWVIGRHQSYHGISSDNLALSDRPNLQIFAPFYPVPRAKIEEHNEFRHRRPDETREAYSRRSAQALEDKILELGPANVAAFIGETIQGGLVGAVPPTPGYWKAIRAVCDEYDVHLILDEVWCGNGSSGRYLCCAWDDVTPDFLVMGKLLAAGYGPVSALMMRAEIADALERSPQGRVQHGSTYQSYTLGIAAALAAQRIVTSDGFTAGIADKGAYLTKRLLDLLADHGFFRNLRGRGLRLALEVSCPDMNRFTETVAARLREEGILVNGKWHRFLFTPAYTVERDQIDRVVERFVHHFEEVAAGWPRV